MGCTAVDCITEGEVVHYCITGSAAMDCNTGLGAMGYITTGLAVMDCSTMGLEAIGCITG